MPVRNLARVPSRVRALRPPTARSAALALLALAAGLAAVLAGCGPPGADEEGRVLVDLRADDVAERMSDALAEGQADAEGDDELLRRAREALDDDSRAYTAELTDSGLVLGAAFYEEFDTEGLADPQANQVVRCVEFRASADDLTDVDHEDVGCPREASTPAWVRGR